MNISQYVPGTTVSPSRYIINSFEDYSTLLKNNDNSSREMILAKWLKEWDIEKFINTPPRHFSFITPDYAPTRVIYTQTFLKPNLDVKITVKSIDQKTIIYPRYRVRTNDYGRRNTFYEQQKLKNTNVLFYGGSFTFGAAVDNKKTFPYLVGKKTGFNTYNFGHPGEGANSTLNRLENHELSCHKGVLPNPTVAVFTFIDDHMKRIVGTSEFFQWYERAYYTPFYYLKDGELVKSSRGFSRPYYKFRWLFKFVGGTSFAELFDLSPLPAIDDDDLLIFAKIVERMKEELKILYPEFEELYVSFFPGNNKYAPRLKVLLAQYNVPYFDYSEINVNELMKGYSMLEHNPHPTAELYDLYAFLMSKDLLQVVGQQD